jgi:tetratricopeptide (TPR) repeat protein
MINKTFYILAAIMVAHSSMAQEAEVTPQQIFERANAAYAAGDYGAAKDDYEKLVRQGSRDPSVYLNLGHTEFQLNREVAAAINYRRVLALDPGNEAARSSLEHVLQSLGVEVPGLGAPEIIGRYISFDLLVLLGSLLFWAGILLVVYAIFSAKKRPGLVVAGVLVAILGSSVVALSWAGDSRVALAQTSIVASDAVEARNAPTDSAQKLADLPMGTPVRVIADKDGWSLVRLPIGVDGWVRSAALEAVFPDLLPEAP